MTKTITALIPARGGSKRVPKKNIRELRGHPLIAYSISAAIEAGIFRDIYVSTDSVECAVIARVYGAKVIHRPDGISGDGSTDYEWISHAIGEVGEADYFCILRPTSPFRMPETIRRAWEAITQDPYADSIRAVSRVMQHPGKMWLVPGKYMSPLMNYEENGGQASFNLPTQALPEIWIQNASLEIGKTRNVVVCHNVSGQRVLPFFSHGLEGFDINTEWDWLLAERLIEMGAQLPEARKAN